MDGSYFGLTGFCDGGCRSFGGGGVFVYCLNRLGTFNGGRVGCFLTPFFEIAFLSR